jgi:hypothetical protein
MITLVTRDMPPLGFATVGRFPSERWNMDSDRATEPSVPDSAARQRLAPLPERQPAIDPPREILQAFGARVLDPTDAVRLTPHEVVYPTVYVGDQLLVVGGESGPVWDDLLAAADDRFTLHPEPRDVALVELSMRDGVDSADLPAVRVQIKLSFDKDDKPKSPPDAWVLLQDYRAHVGPTNTDAKQAVGLNHLLGATPHWSGSGVVNIFGVPHWSGSGTASAEYGEAGWGGRTPVAWLGGPPHRDETITYRRPVVAVFDTEIGPHPWLDDSIVIRDQYVDGKPLGRIAGYEGEPTILDPLEGVLDPDAGHGTFIAGLLRQQCPDANILQVVVMSSAGAVEEGELLHNLELLLRRQQQAIENGEPEKFVDALSLSLGYYHEAPEDQDFDRLLNRPLRKLGQHGMAVVASAGNDATTRTFYPAAFSPHPKGIVPECETDAVPVVSVGAQNPDGTVALFSNAGTWVAGFRMGAALVSTMPTDYDGGGEPGWSVQPPGLDKRESLDPDNFRQGFAVWSGTSFSGPVLAGQVLAQICAGSCGPIDPIDKVAAVDRGWLAVSSQTKLVRP